MDSKTPITFANLPPEIIDQVFSTLPAAPLRNLRLVNRQLGTIATAWAFRHVRLGSRQGCYDHQHFVWIAQSEQLRPLVREVTCDTWLGPTALHCDQFAFKHPSDFLNALPLLRCFRNMSSLHLRFSEHTRHDDTDTMDTETDNFRYRVFDTVFNCLAGTWSTERQLEIDEEVLPYSFEADYETAPAEVADMGPIPIRELTVSNLSDYHDERLTGSEVFKSVISSSSLKDLKMSITLQEVEKDHHGDGYLPSDALWFREKYDMFESLPRTWLSPSVAGNLSVLSLYSRDYWGWNPRMDFRAVRPGNGPDTGFPSLKVLALGSYVFSHEWQVEWIESLGQMNGSGGLEELYLDRCPILIQARHDAPADFGTTIVGTDSDGNNVTISNEGYYQMDVMLDDELFEPFMTYEDYPLRWHHILPRWRQSMKALKVFKMGHSSWDSAPTQTMDVWCSDDGRQERDRENLETLLHHNNFRSFNSPSPPPSERDNISQGRIPPGRLEKYRYGTGINQHPRHQVAYIYFDIGVGPSQWCPIYWPPVAYPWQPQLEYEVKAAAKKELALLVERTQERQRSESW
ncbi:hypothetical protein B0J13DRAFT_563623 [Dactylonectria estremocensis]|uniref:F-box domain-containing protein n=1 Tax=Dactylonectria estremocensis TaxID=1079267 RepID=A0A9P9E3G2_9HYPO|nr:hypothetical protein B0J13DRAFT_563623 [Dactylonectria estremocensis]